MSTFQRAFHELNAVQLAVLHVLSRKKLVALMLPRQVGKTHLGVWCVREVMRQNTNAQSIFLAKDFPSVTRATKDKFLKLFPEQEFNVSALNGITFPRPTQYEYRGSCFLGGVDKAADKFRGGTMAMIHWSEAAFSKFEGGVTFENALYRIFIPMISGTQGMVLAETTPNGSNFWKRFWDEDKAFTKLKIPVEVCIDLGAMSIEQYDFLLKTLPTEVFRQEVLCEFVTFMGKIYKEYAAEKHDTIVEPEPHEYITIGVDIGYSGSNSSILFIVCRNRKRYVFDQIYVAGKRHDELAYLIIQRIAFWRVPARNYTIFTDIDKELMEELQKAGLKATWADKVDVFACRLAIKTAFHNDELFVNPIRCPWLINELNSAVWSEKYPDEMEEAGDPNNGHWDSEASFRYGFRGAMIELEKPEETPSHVKEDAGAGLEWNLREQRRKMTRQSKEPITFEY